MHFRCLIYTRIFTCIFHCAQQPASFVVRRGVLANAVAHHCTPCRVAYSQIPTISRIPEIANYYNIHTVASSRGAEFPLEKRVAGAKKHYGGVFVFVLTRFRVYPRSHPPQLEHFHPEGAVADHRSNIITRRRRFCALEKLHSGHGRCAQMRPERPLLPYRRNPSRGGRGPWMAKMIQFRLFWEVSFLS